ncbi:hypothetical protein OSB04_000431 [Centaurea solstitialis]|uniref:Uncharacterized protein n=1 Tax=Centaurea solstitialis TaxID=347529 RepID=A0AA38TP15_9ASTR|nr:hypothetical protein OSB04_000431 [Centaurea solstitialis]
MVRNIMRGAVNGVPVYLGSIRRGNRIRHPSSWVDLRAGHGRGYGPVTVSMVERISRVPEWIPDTSSTSIGRVHHGSNKNRKLLLEAAVGGVLYHVWKARNNAVFNGKKFSASLVMDDIQAALFTFLLDFLNKILVGLLELGDGFAEALVLLPFCC